MENETTRQAKVASQIKRDMAEIIRARGMAAFSGAMVTVSGVKVSPDLSLAKIYISVFPSEKRDSAMATLDQQKYALRGELGRLVGKQLRIVPEIAFFVDDSLDYVEHIDELLKK
ncbi:MAG: 30S ribosome-binding factor RbfA [Bacteroidales bacterium]|nr:30S ribosome-binding factor RbfA [Bacteroidales bacterium]